MAKVFCSVDFWGSVESHLEGPDAGVIRGFLNEDECTAVLSAFSFNPDDTANDIEFENNE